MLNIYSLLRSIESVEGLLCSYTTDVELLIKMRLFADYSIMIHIHVIWETFNYNI